MNLLCLSGDSVSVGVFAAALHFGWTPADGIAREESWHVYQRRFEFLAARALKDGEWHHFWPTRSPQTRLVFDRRDLRADYVICGEMWCRPLEHFVPRSRAPVVEIAPC